MTLDDIRRIQHGPDADGWDEVERVLCRAADDLHTEHGLTDATWAELTAGFDEHEIIEAIMLVGYYHLVSFVLNALGVPIEPGVESFVTD